MIERQHYALLLSGGGARAAYQVGVLKAITTFLPRNHGVPFPIITGNSAGAINAAALACYASCYHLGVRKLDWVWRNFTTHQVYASGVKDVFSYLFAGYFLSAKSAHFSRRATSLLDNQPLRKLIRHTLDFKRIDRNLLTNHLRAVAVTTSSYTHHESISYFQGQPDILPWQRAQRRGRRCTLNPEHLMASSAIPMVFPTTKIDQEFMGDGSVHLTSPLSTPIHLGAERILVIGVEQPERQQRFSDAHSYPSNAQIAGHLLDTIFADTLHTDLERLNRINSTLDLLTEKQRKQSTLKKIDCMIINPSENFTTMANRHYEKLPTGIKMLLRLIGVKNTTDSSILSYLLFEKEFCQELIQLGYRDGLARQDEIRNFLAI